MKVLIDTSVLVSAMLSDHVHHAHSDSLNNLGFTLKAMRQIEKAAAFAQRLSEVRPDSASSSMNGMLYFTLLCAPLRCTKVRKRGEFAMKSQ